MNEPGALARALADGAERLAAVDPTVLHSIWARTVARWRDAAGPERHAIENLSTEARLSPPAFAAGLDSVLGSVDGDAATRLFEQATGRRRQRRGPVVVVTAGNIPALFVQTLLPALALGRPTLVKAPSSAPRLAARFIGMLQDEARRQGAGAVADGVATAAWRGGDDAVESQVFEVASTVVAYGEAATLEDLERRTAGRLIGYGPMASLAVVTPGADPRSAAVGIARDVALFDQRGCLSVHAVYLDRRWREQRPFLELLAAALRERTAAWPPFHDRASQPLTAAVRLAREAADLSGGWLGDPNLLGGTVIPTSGTAFEPSPGGRLVRVMAIEDLSSLAEHLSPWSGSIQGVAIDAAEFPGRDRLVSGLESLGVSRFSTPGQLQSPDALWHNGGRHPLDALSG